jgi:hypothetical protein
LQSDNFNSLDDFGGDDDDEVLIDTSGRRPPGAKSGMDNGYFSTQKPIVCFIVCASTERKYKT